MKKYRFEKALTVEGVKRPAGAVVPADEIPAGTLEPLLRLGHVVEHDDADPAVKFAAFMGGVSTDAQPAGPGPTVDDVRAAVAEIDRRGRVIAAKHLEIARLTARVAELEAAVKPTDPAPAGPPADVKIDPLAAPEKPVEGKAAAPVIGPTKPPELKAGGKK